MVCYARPAGMLALLTVVASLLFGKSAGHFFDTAAIMVVVLVASALGAVASVFIFTVLMSTRRRRAAAGGCVNCRFSCQHAMAAQSRRPWLVNISDRGAQAPDARARLYLPIEPVTSGFTWDKGLDNSEQNFGIEPHWPDRPIYRHRAPSR
jgi:hypothetical protein